jgi:hypothetical protein|tara:strand:+ start:206 stop:397 length:192 start_codon:yes stop_codon:yes gene_type:complete
MHKQITDILQGIAKKKSLNYNLAIRKTKQHWTQKLIDNAEKSMTPAKFKVWMEHFERDIKKRR